MKSYPSRSASIFGLLFATTWYFASASARDLHSVRSSGHRRVLANGPPSVLSARQFEWDPRLPECATECSVFTQAAQSCAVSSCLCTDAVAQGFEQCMVCSIDLANNPVLLSDAQQSMDGFEETCQSAGNPVTPITVTVGGQSSSVPTSVPPAAPTPSVTASSVSTVSASLPAVSGGGTAGSSFVVPTPSSAPTIIQSPSTTASNAGSSSSDQALNPSSPPLANSAYSIQDIVSESAKRTLPFFIMITLVL